MRLLRKFLQNKEAEIYQMLPENVETPRARYLQDIIQKTPKGDWADWPALNRDDYILVGGIVVLYSYIDLNLRHIADITDRAGLLRAPWKGKATNLTITDVEKAVQSLDWSEPNIAALQKITRFRGLRNLLAHFVIRRFPNDDAFVFVAISPRDHKRQLGREPEQGELLTAVVEHEQLKGALKHIEHVQLWLSKATSELEKQISPAPP